MAAGFKVTLASCPRNANQAPTQLIVALEFEIQ